MHYIYLYIHFTSQGAQFSAHFSSGAGGFIVVIRDNSGVKRGAHRRRLRPIRVYPFESRLGRFKGRSRHGTDSRQQYVARLIYASKGKPRIMFPNSFLRFRLGIASHEYPTRGFFARH